MHTSHTHRLIASRLCAGAVLTIALAVAACSEGPAGPGAAPPFRQVVWHLTQLGGQSMPALVSQRQFEIGLERTYADSAHIEIMPNGQWRERVHVRKWLNREVTLAETRLDEGTWISTDSGYVFTSTATGAHARTLAVTADSVVFRRRLPGEPASELRTASYRSDRPAAGMHAVWHATKLNGASLPATMYHFDPDTVEHGRAVSIHLILDSAHVAILPTGEYVHRVYVSEWEGVPGGPPTVLRVRLWHYDRGDWQLAGAAVRLESGYLMNHRMDGTWAAGALRLTHGFSVGDPTREITYGDRR